MSVKASAGTTFSISAGVPATFDASGYNGLSFTAVGEVDDFGEFGATWANENHNPVALKGTQKVKTSRDPGGLTLGMALDTDNSGQILMKAAHASTALYAILITTPEGDKYYAQALVNDFKVIVGGQSAKKRATTSLAISTSATDVDWVESLAA